MTNEQLAAFRKQLLDLRNELLTLEQNLDESGSTVELDQSRVGRLSRMDAMQAQQMALAARRRQKSQLAAIDGALRRIDAGEYGDCYVCGGEIDLRRLTIDPTSTRCVNCLES